MGFWGEESGAMAPSLVLGSSFPMLRSSYQAFEAKLKAALTRPELKLSDLFLSTEDKGPQLKSLRDVLPSPRAFLHCLWSLGPRWGLGLLYTCYFHSLSNARNGAQDFRPVKNVINHRATPQATVQLGELTRCLNPPPGVGVDTKRSF